MALAFTAKRTVGIAALLAVLLACAPRPAPAQNGRGGVRGPAIVVQRQPAVPLVSLRLSVLADDPPGYAGAGHLIQHLLYPGLQERVSRVGGAVQIQRTADAVVYTATGPASELAELADLLISAMEPTVPALDAMLRASRELREERLAEWETAPTHARSVLRAQLFPAELSAAGTDRSAAQFTTSMVPDLWRAMYHPDRVSVVAVGDVYLADVQEAFAGIPGAPVVPDLRIEQDSVFLGPLAPAEATRAWLGIAFPADGLEPAAVTTATSLLAGELRQRLPAAQVDAEHWWTHDGQAIVLIVAVPGSQVDAVRRSLDAAPGELARDLSFLRVVNAATAIRREMMFHARTPDRMAEVIGQFVDRSTDPAATERFFAELAEVDDEDVRQVLGALADRTPVRVEIPPQALRPRRR